MSTRDEFSTSVKRTVAERAGYICSRPECSRLTIGPHTSPDKSLSTGVVAHICAAASGGPRFAPDQSEEKRKSIDNAIWLCHSCSDLIDKDESRFTSQVLLKWKVEHEQLIAEDGGAPRLPEISLNTISGLTLPNSGPSKVTGEDITRFREHILVIGNGTCRVIT